MTTYEFKQFDGIFKWSIINPIDNKRKTSLNHTVCTETIKIKIKQLPSFVLNLLTSISLTLRITSPTST